MARRVGKMRGDMRALEIQANDPRTNPITGGSNGRMIGAGATPSMGLSQFRGGGTRKGMMRKTARKAYESMPRNEAHMMGEALSKHIHDLHGAGFWSDFGNGFKKGFTGTLDFLSPAIEKAVPGFSKHYETGKKILGFGASESQRAATMLGMKKKGRSRNNGPALLSGNVDGVFSGGSHDSDYGSESESDNECGGANTGAYEGHGRMVGGRKPNARAAIVKKVMAEKGMKMIEASKYVKEHGLY